MDINEILGQKNMTKYRLSKISGVPFTTISEICTGKSKIKNCTGETIYKLASALDVAMEDLIADSMESRPGFENYKSSICHRVSFMGDMAFIIDVLESDRIRALYRKKWYPECLYLLAMVDYLSRENDLPICSDYSDIRAACLQKPIYPAGIIAMSVFLQSDLPKMNALHNSIPEFRRFNIVENEVRNVC